jgi:hypothetical protein
MSLIEPNGYYESDLEFVPDPVNEVTFPETAIPLSLRPHNPGNESRKSAWNSGEDGISWPCRLQLPKFSLAK